MYRKIRNWHFFFIDIVLLGIIPLIAYSLIVSDLSSSLIITSLVIYTLLSLIIKIPVFYGFKLYRRYWLYASVDDLFSILIATGLTTTILMIIVLIFRIFDQFTLFVPPWHLPLLDGFLTALILSSSRFTLRMVTHNFRIRISRKESNKRILVVGAGEAGKIVANEIRTSRLLQKNMIGFVDDDPQKINTIIYGVQVYGPIGDLPNLIHRLQIHEVIIAIPSAPGSVIRRILDLCESTGVETLTMPGLYELLNDRVKVSTLRPLEIADLLRRDPIEIDMGEVHALLAGKRVMVTGAGGSIGSELCLQIANCRPECLVALGHGENSLVALSDYLDGHPCDPFKYHPVVADIRDLPRLDAVFHRFKPHIIFHAAAHKHVPLLEDNVEEAVTNNIIGTWNLVQISRKYNIFKFVLISSDKAVQPINVMGMTKQIAERIVWEAASQTNRPYVSVRFGNVLGSRGSVIPRFNRQIESGGPITITHPEVDRYFMTIPEAVQLVLQAAAVGQNGEVFILDMGDPIKIADLAQDMIRLSGLQEGRDICIEYTGLRPGERLHEKLFSEDENLTHTVHEKIFFTHHDLSPSHQYLTIEIQELQQLAAEGRTDELRQKLKALTGYKPSTPLG